MTLTAFDTLKFANALKEAGVNPRQAEAEAQLLGEAFAVNLRELPTKEDLRHANAELRAEFMAKCEQILLLLRETEQRLQARIERNDTDLVNLVGETKAELVKRVDDTKAELVKLVSDTKAELLKVFGDIRTELLEQMKEDRTEVSRQIEDVKAKLHTVDESATSKIAKLQAELREVEQRLNAKFDLLKTELGAKIDLLRTESNAKIDLVRSDLNARIDKLEVKIAGDNYLIRWMLGLILMFLVGLSSAAVRYFLFKS